MAGSALPRAQDVLGGRYRLDTPVGPRRDDGRQDWEATDTVLARPVLVELGPPDSGAGLATAVAIRLTHPNIAAVYDTGADGEHSWVVVEFPRGRFLREVLDHAGPLPAWRVTSIGRQIAGALSAAHRAGAPHGQLGPDRVILTDDDRVKLVGFTGSASPEVDVAAAGALIYEMLCGHPPALTSEREPPSPRELRPGIPPALDGLVMRALGYGTGSLSADALQGALAAVDVTSDDAVPEIVRDPTPPVGVRPLARRHRRPAWELPLVVLIVLAAAVGTALVIGLSSGKHTPPVAAPGTSAASGHAVAITGAVAFDPPPGDGHEDDTNLPHLIDSNPATSWSTESYTNSNFGNLKHGVGVYLTLARGTKLRTLVITSPSRGWTAQVYVAAQPAGALSGWGQPVGPGFTVTSTDTNVDLRGVSGSAVLLWITNLGDASPAQVTIAELRLLS